MGNNKPNNNKPAGNNGNSKKKAQAATAALQGKKDKQRRTVVQIGVAVVLIALIAVIGFNIASDDSGDETAGSAATPSVVTEDGAIRIGDPDADVVVTVVEDFQCPACQQFEAISGDTLAELAADNTVAVDYKPIAILDRASSTNYSTRSANAAMCVADADISAWPTWHDAMFEQQPAEGGAGLSDDDLIGLAQLADVEGPDLESCITDGAYTDFVTAQTQAVLDSGVTGTPTVSVNGTVVSNPAPDELRAAVADAQ